MKKYFIMIISGVDKSRVEENIMVSKIISFVSFCLILIPLNGGIAQEPKSDTQTDLKPETTLGQKLPEEKKDRMALMRKTLEARWVNVQRILKEDPNNIKLLVEGGQIARLVREKKMAINYYRRAVSLMLKSPDMSKKTVSDLQKTIINLYLRLYNSNMAIVEFKEYHNMFPDDYDIHVEFAEFLKKNGFPRRAFFEYQKILEKKPDDLILIDKIMQLYAQGHITKEELQQYMDK